MTGVPIRTPPPRRSAGASVRTAPSVSGLGAILLCALAVTGEPLPLGDWRFWLMGALVLVGELMPIDVPRRDGADRVAISTAFAFAMLLQFGLLPAVLAYAAASRDRGRQLAAAAREGHVQRGAVRALAGRRRRWCSRRSATRRRSPRSPTALPAVLASGATFFLVNHVLAGVGVALIIGESPAHYLLSDLPFQVLTAGFVLALSPVVVASSEASMALVPLALLPVLALYIGARRAALRHPPRVPRRAHGPPEPAAAARAARAARWRGRAPRTSRWRCCWSTSTTSRPSTTRSATPTATACSATSPTACAPRSGATTCSPASAATSSPCCPAGACDARARPRGRRAAGRRARAAVRGRRDPARRPRQRRPRLLPRPRLRPRRAAARRRRRALRRQGGPAARSRSTPPARTTTRSTA